MDAVQLSDTLTLNSKLMCFQEDLNFGKKKSQLIQKARHGKEWEILKENLMLSLIKLVKSFLMLILFLFARPLTLKMRYFSKSNHI
jgi:hypothetical protein